MLPRSAARSGNLVGMKKVITLFLIAACGSSGGGGGTVDAPTNHPTDGATGDSSKVFLDAPANVPTSITVSGTATVNDLNSSTPVSGATIGFFKASDDSMLATATSGTGGAYTMSVATNGAAVDGYVKATNSGDADNYTYPPGPLVANATIDSALVTTGNFGLLAGVTGQTSTMGFVAAIVLDASNHPVMGASVTSTPASGKYAYSGTLGPDTNATATAADGQAYFINVPSGNLTLSAAKSGTTFHSVVVKGHPGALTTTVIQP
jgi:hypothetical protein